MTIEKIFGLCLVCLASNVELGFNEALTVCKTCNDNIEAKKKEPVEQVLKIN